MAQHDFNIANQSFPSFRTDLNNALSAINTSQSGTSRPSGAVAGTIWLDTTSATTPTLKYYDGADDISLATLDHSANTVNWLDSTVSVTGLTTTATGTVLTLSDSSLTSSVNLILQNQKEIRFSETTANGTNYVGFKAPASLSADKIWVLPSADGTAGQFLKTDGAGNLSFDSLSFSTPLAVIGNATAGSEIRLPEDTDNGSNYVAIKAPDTIASNLTLTLPSADGTSGQVLQTNGSGVLSFSSPSAGSLVFLGETSASNVASVDLNGYFTSSYDVYKIFLEGWYTHATGNIRMSFRYNTGSYTTQTTNYYSAFDSASIDSSSTVGESGRGTWNGSTADFGFSTSTSNSTSQRRTVIELTLYNPRTTSYYKHSLTSCGTFADNQDYIYKMDGHQAWFNTTEVTGIRFLSASGNITVNKIRLYGIKNS
jgi:hypothetical protein